MVGEREEGFGGSIVGEIIGKSAGLVGAVRVGLGLDDIVQKIPDVSADTRVTFDITMAAISALLLAKMGGKIGSYIGYHGILNSIPQAYRDFREYLRSRNYHETKVED
jgi:hypothetical protein